MKLLFVCSFTLISFFGHSYGDNQAKLRCMEDYLKWTGYWKSEPTQQCMETISQIKKDGEKHVKEFYDEDHNIRRINYLPRTEVKEKLDKFSNEVIDLEYKNLKMNEIMQEFYGKQQYEDLKNDKTYKNLDIQFKKLKQIFTLLVDEIFYKSPSYFNLYGINSDILGAVRLRNKIKNDDEDDFCLRKYVINNKFMKIEGVQIEENPKNINNTSAIDCEEKIKNFMKKVAEDIANDEYSEYSRYSDLAQSDKERNCFTKAHSELVFQMIYSFSYLDEEIMKKLNENQKKQISEELAKMFIKSNEDFIACFELNNN